MACCSAQIISVEQFTPSDDPTQFLGDYHADNPLSADPLNVFRAACSTPVAAGFVATQVL